MDNLHPSLTCKLFIPPLKDSDATTTTTLTIDDTLYSLHTSTTCIAMSALLAGYGSSDDEAAPSGPSLSTTKPTTTASANRTGVQADEEDESDDEKLEAQARTDAFGLNETNGSASQTRDRDGKLVVASAPDVLREVCCVTRYRLDRADEG